MPASAPERVNSEIETIFPVPTSLVSKLAVPPIYETLSPLIILFKERFLIVAVVLPSYTLLSTATLPVAEIAVISPILLTKVIS